MNVSVFISILCSISAASVLFPPFGRRNVNRVESLQGNLSLPRGNIPSQSDENIDKLPKSNIRAPAPLSSMNLSGLPSRPPALSFHNRAFLGLRNRNSAVTPSSASAPPSGLLPRSAGLSFPTRAFSGFRNSAVKTSSAPPAKTSSSSFSNVNTQNSWQPFDSHFSEALPHCSCGLCTLRRALSSLLNEEVSIKTEKKKSPQDKEELDKPEDEKSKESKTPENDHKPELYRKDVNIKFIQNYSNNVTKQKKDKVVETIYYLLMQKREPLDAVNRAVIDNVVNERVKKDPEGLKALKKYEEKYKLGVKL